MSYSLFNQQRTILDLATDHQRYLFLAEMGTGKTLPLAIHVSNLLIGGEIDDALILAPLAGLGAWQRDFEKLSQTRQDVLRKSVMLTNYEKISRKGSPWQKKCDRDWGCVVLDEGHAIANPTSNRTQYLVGKTTTPGVVHRARYFYELTGTLINNSRLEDYWAPLRAVFGESWRYYLWADFKRHYLIMKTIPGSYAEFVVGYRHREELTELLATCSYRVLKADCLDLPAVLPDEVIYVPWAEGRNAEPFNATTKQLYTEAMDSYIDALDIVSDNPLTRLLRLRQIAAGHIKESDTVDERGRRHRGVTHRLKSSKTRYAMELIEGNLPHQTVVGYHFRATCDRLEAELSRTHIPYVTLNGDQSDKNIWRRFQADDTIKVIVVQYQSGSMAIDLYASAYTVFMEPTDSSMLCEQFRARTDRHGQTRPVSYTWLLTEDSVEVDMYSRLSKHRDFAEKEYREIAKAQGVQNA